MLRKIGREDVDLNNPGGVDVDLEDVEVVEIDQSVRSAPDQVT